MTLDHRLSGTETERQDTMSNVIKDPILRT